jgi:uncharacterized protein
MATFAPRPWLHGAHRQTLVSHFARRKGRLRYRRERWDTPDGDFLDIDFAEVDGSTWAELGHHAPVGLIIHGLGGSAESGYVWDACRELARRGIRPVAMNCRGSGGTPNRGDRLYHAGDDVDPGFVLDRLHDRFDVPIGVIGYSLGGSMLLNYLGRRGSDAPERLHAAVSVSAPLDLAACAVRIEQRGSKVYSRRILQHLRRLVTMRDEMPGGDWDAAMRARTIRDFDEALIAPLHGFLGADDYYARSSASQVLADIAVPTLMLRSLDDPFLDASDVEDLGHLPQVELCLQPTGGHVGFVRLRRRGFEFWGEKRAASWMAERLI